ncbi:uncharacterized protein LOC133193102 [Saccostrea echinata]|uniref:uncharacterized protein LOC133193102 n=1 Tax=Saccostrea echinata TaxID=191078 RepID=UPI002A834626|nr:uncharacterized protein LOC133193102 [Saccostrea echinata]
MATLLLKIVYYSAIFCIYKGLSFVKAQNVRIQIQPSSINLGQDDLIVTCSTVNPSQLDTVYTIQLQKNDTNTYSMKDVVSVRPSNGQDTITWQDTELQSRATATGTVSTPATAQLKLTIPKDQVLCQQDFTGYMCTMSGFTNVLVTQETSPEYVTYIVHPKVIEMPSVRILGEFSNTPSRQFPVNTAIQLTCTGQIGTDASAAIRWCAKKSQDLTFTGLPQTPIHSEASPSIGCQYTRSSTITYNLTSDDTYTQFLCESGYSGLCETGTARQYLNITLEQNVQIQIQSSSVNLGQDDLVVTCSTVNPSQLDTVYTIQLRKNNTNTYSMKDVVSVRSRNGQDITTWQDTELQSRATATGTVSTPATAQLKLTIPKDRVLCPQDFTGYMCTMSLFTNALGTQETNKMYVTYTVHPKVIEMPSVRILGEFSNTPSRQFPVNTAIQLTCTGQIGSDASATIRWCAKKSQDFTFTGLPQTPVHSEASPSTGCQYTRSSTITYNLTSDDTYTQFLCESGSSGLCETGTATQYLNITLAQNLQIQVQPLSVTLGQNDLVVTCSTINPSQINTVFTMQIQKNNTNTYSMKDVVSVRSSSGQDTTTWQDTDLQNRATVTATVSSPAIAQLKLTIPKDQVLCPQDFTGYMCTMSGFTNAAVNQVTSPEYVTYIVHPKVIQMPSVKILNEFSNTALREFPVGTALQLSCTGQIGSDPSATIRWCAKKSQDFTFTGLPQTPVHSEASPSPGCQYTRSSTITNNLTSDDTYTQFLCESGHSGLCETGTAKQYLNITLEGRIISTHSLPNCVSTNENLSIIFGSLFGVFFCICAGLMAYLFFYKFSKKRRGNHVEKNGKNGDYVMHVTGFDDHQYQGIDGNARKTTHQENNAQYDVLGSRDSENVYDKVKDVNAEERQ